MDAITVIILNWNGRALLPACLESVRAQTYQPLRIMVVDNASADGSAEWLRAAHPEVEVVANAANLGFGGGNNAGIRRCDTPFLVVLNNDTRLHPDCVAELKRALDADPGAGACASRILLEREGDRLDAAGLAPAWDGMAIGRGRMEDPARYLRQEEVFFASDCCVLYRKAMLDDIAVAGEYYDEDFFAYADETDLGWRARARGWRCLYAPGAVVRHRHSATSGDHSPFKAYLVERNRICVAIKNFPPSLLLAGLPYSLARYCWQAYGALAGRGRAGDFVRDHGRLGLAWILARAHWGALRLLPRMWRKRRIIRSRSRLPAAGYRALLRAYGIGARELALKK